MASAEDEVRVAVDDAAGDAEERGDLLMKEKNKRSAHLRHGKAPAMMLVVDPATQRFPFCIVWSPIPVLTWLLPFIGHLGIADSKGVIFDFAGPYTIGRDSFAFGIPTRYVQCTVKKDEADKWDAAVADGCAVYATRMHNLCCDNCHSHVAECLENVQYKGIKRWNMVMLCFWVFFCGRYVDTVGFLKSWAPSLLILAFIVLVHSTTS